MRISVAVRRLVCVALTTASTALVLGAPGAKLRSEIKNSAGQKIPGALVTVASLEAPAELAVTHADAKGFVALDGLAEGPHRMLARAPGYAPGGLDQVELGGPFRAVADLVLKPGAEVAPPIELPAGVGSSAQIGVAVVDDEGKPLAGVLVRCEPVGHVADPDSGRTDATGTLTLGPLAQGAYRLTVVRAGWTRIVLPSVSWTGGELRLLARLQPTGESPAPIEDLLPPAELLP